MEPLAAKSENDLDDHFLAVIKRTSTYSSSPSPPSSSSTNSGTTSTSLVAGLGIGGLAFALAAQDLLGNLFGGVAIFADKPFKLGETVKTGDVEGTVKEIGLRTTRIETYNGTLIVVPNRKVADNNLENISQEKARRVVVKLGLDGMTSAKRIAAAKVILQRCVQRTKGLKEECTVSFTGFGDNGPTITFIYWITKEGMKDYWGVHDRLYTAINAEFEKAHIRTRLPDDTVYMRK